MEIKRALDDRIEAKIPVAAEGKTEGPNVVHDTPPERGLPQEGVDVSDETEDEREEEDAE